MKVLVVDDELHIQELIKYNLEELGFIVEVAGDGLEASQIFDQSTFDVVILDVMMPRMNGIEVLKYIRDSKQDHVAVIMLTAKADEIDRVLGLELGADDYIAKPFSVRELQARVKAVLRRYSSKEEQSSDSKYIRYKDIVINTEKYEVEKGELKIPLSLKEYELLKLLVENQGKVLTRDFLLDKIWGYEYFRETRTVDVHIRYLRKKLDDEGEIIETARGIGYRVG